MHACGRLNPTTHEEKILGENNIHSFTLKYVGTHKAPLNNNLENYKENPLNLRYYKMVITMISVE